MRPILVDWLARLVGDDAAVLLAPTYFTLVALAGLAAALVMIQRARAAGDHVPTVINALLFGYTAAVVGGIVAPMLFDAGAQLAAGRFPTLRWAGMVAYVGFSPPPGNAFVTCIGPIFNRPDSLRFWSLPRELPAEVKIGAAKKRVPAWLPELAEAVCGSRLTPHGYESTSAEPSFASLEKKIRASASGGD